MLIKRALNKESLYDISVKLDEKFSRGISYSSQIVFSQFLHYTCFSSATCPLQVPGLSDFCSFHSEYLWYMSGMMAQSPYGKCSSQSWYARFFIKYPNLTWLKISIICFSDMIYFGCIRKASWAKVGSLVKSFNLLQTLIKQLCLYVY